MFSMSEMFFIYCLTAKIADTGTMENEEEDDITFDIDQEDDEIDDVINSILPLWIKCSSL